MIPIDLISALSRNIVEGSLTCPKNLSQCNLPTATKSSYEFRAILHHMFAKIAVVLLEGGTPLTGLCTGARYSTARISSPEWKEVEGFF